MNTTIIKQAGYDTLFSLPTLRPTPHHEQEQELAHTGQRPTMPGRRIANKRPEWDEATRTTGVEMPVSMIQAIKAIAAQYDTTSSEITRFLIATHPLMQGYHLTRFVKERLLAI